MRERKSVLPGAVGSGEDGLVFDPVVLNAVVLTVAFLLERHGVILVRVFCTRIPIRMHDMMPLGVERIKNQLVGHRGVGALDVLVVGMPLIVTRVFHRSPTDEVLARITVRLRRPCARNVGPIFRGDDHRFRKLPIRIGHLAERVAFVRGSVRIRPRTRRRPNVATVPIFESVNELERVLVAIEVGVHYRRTVSRHLAVGGFGLLEVIIISLAASE